MDSNAASAGPASPPGQPAPPELRTEVIGTVLLFALTVMITAGVALCAHLLVRAFG